MDAPGRCFHRHRSRPLIQQCSGAIGRITCTPTPKHQCRGRRNRHLEATAHLQRTHCENFALVLFPCATESQCTTRTDEQREVMGRGRTVRILHDLGSNTFASDGAEARLDLRIAALAHQVTQHVLAHLLQVLRAFAPPESVVTIGATRTPPGRHRLGRLRQCRYPKLTPCLCRAAACGQVSVAGPLPTPRVWRWSQWRRDKHATWAEAPAQHSGSKPAWCRRRW
jgi:hypothetical protein